MTTRMFAVLAVLGVGLSFGCNQKGEPPPQFNMGMSDGNTRLLPIRLVKRDKNSLIAAASTSETPAATPAGGTGSSSAAAAAVPIDDSTPENFAKSIEAVMKAGSLAQIPDLVIPDRKEKVQQFVNVFLPVIEAQAELKKVLDDKFAGHAIQIPNASDALASMLGDVTITDIKPVDDENAEGTLHVKTPAGEKTEALKFKKSDGKWRWDDSAKQDKEPSPEELEKLSQVMGKMADAFKAVAKKVNDGEVADEKAAQEELGKAMLRVTVGAAGDGSAAPDATGGDNTATPPAGDTKAAEPAAPKTETPAPATEAKPKNDQPDEVDQSYSGPGQLRRRK